MTMFEADHHNRQRRVLGITDRILQIIAELRELADELDGMGCTCGKSGAEIPHGHNASCTLTIAWVLRSHEGLEPPDASITDRVREEAKDIRHLAAPFRSTAIPKAKS